MKSIYLTIDDAPSKYFEQKINYLYDNKIPAILFCEGNKIEKNKSQLIDALKKGYIIGNHSFSHPHFSDLNMERCHDEIYKTDRIIQKLYDEYGIKWRVKYFRFPFLDRGGNADSKTYENKQAITDNDKIVKIQNILKELRYVKPDFKGITYEWYNKQKPDEFLDAGCTFDQAEYYFNNSNAPHGLNEEKAILNRIEEDIPEEGRGLNFTGSTDIIVIHDHEHTNDIFFKCIKRYMEKGFKFILPEV